MKRLAFSLFIAALLSLPAAQAQFSLGKIYRDNGISAMQNKDYGAAVNWLTMAHNVVGDSDKKLDGRINELLGQAYMKLNDLQNAEIAFKIAYGHYEQEYGAFNGNTARILDQFAELSFRRNDYWSANSFLRKSFDYSMGVEQVAINDLVVIPYRVKRLTYWASKTGNDIELEFERGLSALAARRVKSNPDTQSKIDATMKTILADWKAWAQKNSIALTRYDRAAGEYAPSQQTAAKPPAGGYLSGLDLPSSRFDIPALRKIPNSPAPNSFLFAPATKTTSDTFRPANPFESTKEFLKSHESSYSHLQSELFRSDD
jgi:tetratricopeptide (TPR) repeat protein